MISRLLLFIGIVCLGLYGFFQVQAHFHQEALEEQLDHSRNLETRVEIDPIARKTLKEGDLFGRLEIPRLNLSVMVMEGDGDAVLRLGAGRVPATGLAIAAHRDTFFRPLKDIRPSDVIRVTTPQGSTEYRVTSTKIVGPTDTSVIEQKSPDTLTLITCYPFYYIGPAPKRFIVEAARD